MRAAPVVIALLATLIAPLAAIAAPRVAMPEKMDRSRCRELADKIAPLVPKLDALEETLKEVNADLVEPQPDGLSRERATAAYLRSKYRGLLTALREYRHMAEWRMRRLRNCEAGGVQPAPF